jgi:hypothetical protein
MRNNVGIVDICIGRRLVCSFLGSPQMINTSIRNYSVFNY